MEDTQRYCETMDSYRRVCEAEEQEEQEDEGLDEELDDELDEDDDGER